MPYPSSTTAPKHRKIGMLSTGTCYHGYRDDGCGWEGGGVALPGW